MELKERLKVCTMCTNGKFDTTKGIICSLTNEKPDFEERCKDFVIDPREAQKIAVKKQYSVEEDTSNRSIIWVIIAMILLAIKLIRYLYH